MMSSPLSPVYLACPDFCVLLLSYKDKSIVICGPFLWLHFILITFQGPVSKRSYLVKFYMLGVNMQIGQHSLDYCRAIVFECVTIKAQGARLSRLETSLPLPVALIDC